MPTDEQAALEAQERAARSIGDRQAAAKARARLDELADARERLGIVPIPVGGKRVTNADVNKLRDELGI